jgi:MFS family permease
MGEKLGERRNRGRQATQQIEKERAMTKPLGEKAISGGEAGKGVTEVELAGTRITGYMWMVLFVALAGYIFDAFEVMLYSNALVEIKKEFSFNFAGSGTVMTLSLLGYAVGGMFWGPMTDKIGRIKVMMWTVAGYALFTGLTAVSWSALSLIGFRFLMGFFAGGEWAAGAALITETWPAKYRGRVMAVMQTGWPIGAIFASIVYAGVAPSWGWRWVFVSGIVPAVIVFIIRMTLKESDSFQQHKASGTQISWTGIFQGKYKKRTIMFILISFIGLLGYWCIMTWIPAMLRAERGMTIFQSSMWFIVINVGSMCGYLSFGFVADHLGRRPGFSIYWLVAMIAAPMFAFYAKDPTLMVVFGFILGISMGYFSGYPLYGSELWPTALRASGMGIAYTGIARVGSTFGPMVIGAVADKVGIATAISVMASSYILAVILIWAMGYETKGKTLGELNAM